MLAVLMTGAMVIGMTACGTETPTETTVSETTTAYEEPLEDNRYAPVVSYNVNGSTTSTAPDAISKIDFGNITKTENPDFEKDQIEFINNCPEGEDVTITFVYDGSLGELTAKKVAFNKGENDITDKSTITKDANVENGYIFNIPADVLHAVAIGDEVSVKIGIGENSSMELNFIIAG